ncbi:MAG: DUF3107 domain-containing protein [Cellulomonadaceae bacterium]
MEITIGVQHLPRELVLETDESADSVAKSVAKALTDGSILELTDTKGRRVLVPVRSLGYIELGSEEQRRVGFGTV